MSDASGNSRKRLFSGFYPVTVDGQRRLAMPKSWRLPSDTADTLFYLLPGRNKRIYVLTEERFNRMLESSDNVAIMDGEGMSSHEAIGLQLQVATLDKQGRFQLNANLAQHAEIDKKAVFCGAIFCGTIVAPENLRSDEQSKEQTYNYLQRLEEQNIKQRQNS